MISRSCLLLAIALLPYGSHAFTGTPVTGGSLAAKKGLHRSHRSHSCAAESIISRLRRSHRRAGGGSTEEGLMMQDNRRSESSASRSIEADSWPGPGTSAPPTAKPSHHDTRLLRARARGHGVKTTGPMRGDGSAAKGAGVVIEGPEKTLSDALTLHMTRETCAVHPGVALTIDEAFKDLDDIFYGNSGWRIPEDEIKRIQEVGGDATYGELLPSGTDALTHLFGMDESSVFYDLGSGTGRSLLHVAASQPNIRKAVGIELSQTRTDYAREALYNLDDLAVPRCEVEFREQDIQSADMRDATHVFTSSVCFGGHLLRSIAQKCAESESFRVLLSLRELPLQPYLVKIGESRIPCTFHGAQPCFIYVRHGMARCPPTVAADLLCRDGVCWLPPHLEHGETLFLAPP